MNFLRNVLNGAASELKSIIFKFFSFAMKLLIGTPIAKYIWKIPGARSIYNKLISARPEYVELHNNRFYLDANDSLLLSVNNGYEENEIELFRNLLSSEGSGDVLDIGGHIGYYTLQASDLVDGIVYVFEPSPDNFATLSKNIEFNNKENIKLVNKAVSDTAGDELLFISSENTGDHRIGHASHDTKAHGESVAIQTIVMDDFLKEKNNVYPNIKVIKMDIQGAEPFALAGMKKVIKAQDELVMFTEASREHLGDNLVIYLATLENLGFTLYEVDDNDPTLRLTNADDLDKKITRNDANVVAVKGKEMTKWATTHLVQ